MALMCSGPVVYQPRAAIKQCLYTSIIHQINDQSLQHQQAAMSLPEKRQDDRDHFRHTPWIIYSSHPQEAEHVYEMKRSFFTVLRSIEKST